MGGGRLSTPRGCDSYPLSRSKSPASDKWAVIGLAALTAQKLPSCGSKATEEASCKLTVGCCRQLLSILQVWQRSQPTAQDSRQNGCSTVCSMCWPWYSSQPATDGLHMSRIKGPQLTTATSIVPQGLRAPIVGVGPPHKHDLASRQLHRQP